MQKAAPKNDIDDDSSDDDDIDLTKSVFTPHKNKSKKPKLIIGKVYDPGANAQKQIKKPVELTAEQVEAEGKQPCCRLAVIKPSYC